MFKWITKSAESMAVRVSLSRRGFLTGAGKAALGVASLLIFGRSLFSQQPNPQCPPGFTLVTSMGLSCCCPNNGNNYTCVWKPTPPTTCYCCTNQGCAPPPTGKCDNQVSGSLPT